MKTQSVVCFQLRVLYLVLLLDESNTQLAISREPSLQLWSKVHCPRNFQPVQTGGLSSDGENSTPIPYTDGRREKNFVVNIHHHLKKSLQHPSVIWDEFRRISMTFITFQWAWQSWSSNYCVLRGCVCHVTFILTSGMDQSNTVLKFQLKLRQHSLRAGSMENRIYIIIDKTIQLCFFLSNHLFEKKNFFSCHLYHDYCNRYN